MNRYCMIQHLEPALAPVSTRILLCELPVVSQNLPSQRSHSTVYLDTPNSTYFVLRLPVLNAAGVYERRVPGTWQRHIPISHSQLCQYDELGLSLYALLHSSSTELSPELEGLRPATQFSKYLQKENTRKSTSQSSVLGKRRRGEGGPGSRLGNLPLNTQGGL